jgi:hypothetical protein
MNKIKIIKDSNLNSKVFLNNIPLEKVLDLSYNKTSAYDSTEVVIKIAVDEIEETFKQTLQ